VKVGDLVRVKNSTTGDNSQMVRLYRERTPLLVWALQHDISWTHVLEGGVKRIVPMCRLEVISDAK
jgi:hypothetical protein